MSTSQLLDQNIESYVISGKNASKTIIEDQGNNTLALIKETSLGGGCVLVVPGGKTIVKIRSKFMSSDMIMEDSEKKIIGKIKNQKGILILQDKTKEPLLIGTWFTRKFPYCEITDKNQNLIASFSMTLTSNRKRRWFSQWYDKYTLHIHDLSFSRLILLGFFTYVHYELSKPNSMPLFFPG